MKSAHLGGRPCPAPACSSARCCGGSSARGPPSGWRPSAPAVVTVRTADGAAGTAPTFSAYDHHYALVVVEGLDPGQHHDLRGAASTTRWSGRCRSSGFPPSVIRTRAADDRDQPVRLIFGSCRETTQHATRPQAAAGRARRVRPAVDRRPGPEPRWPDLLVLLGDQVYADVTSPTVRRLLQRRRRRPKDAPATQVVELRRVHQALPGVLARSGDPLAALHRAERDDLRRPRDHRRLEHLGRLAGGHAPAAVVGRADPQRARLATGSTSTWATSPRTRSPPTRSTPR